jgi:hypothetical protein
MTRLLNDITRTKTQRELGTELSSQLHVQCNHVKLTIPHLSYSLIWHVRLATASMFLYGLGGLIWSYMKDPV